ncbi:hypothetical protein P8C59_001329 [Phyllachora maydis]|uniref:Amino-acid acetyltransferase, mitochondrial n=1 Tax=Phyllachora maydis TaxID=1825666 RepID=A0AAD9MC63_9PEZI|nr:hypothetical protein P8C59_001329 [Phyllachora maydis]
MSLRSAAWVKATKKSDQDREFLISVLESSATKRDAKAYLKTFAPRIIKDNKDDGAQSSPAAAAATKEHEPATSPIVQGAHPSMARKVAEPPHVAAVKVRRPQDWDDATLEGVAQALAKLRYLGLLSVIVVDCDVASSVGRNLAECRRIYAHEMNRLRNDEADGIVDANEVVLALVSFFSGLESPDDTSALPGSNQTRSSAQAHVDRVIVIDPLGGIPSKHANHGTRQTLEMLPSTSSVVITSPAEAANLRPPQRDSGILAFTGDVATRKKQNTLIHNLLTDRPVYSPSLPIGRVNATQESTSLGELMPTTTLVKRGLPVTIFPDPHLVPWEPPRPGAPRLRLTDTCIDLPRLVHLINDSFGRELDVERYLQRVHDSLAGIIIAGEYEGGAILTWERPHSMDEATAYKRGRLVPYLDKFAVLRKSQGAGGVADIVFNAMTADCFPDGVCWRSRKDNPVNKWYFERSKGTRVLPNSNWTMFWTTPDAHVRENTVVHREGGRKV